MFFFSGSRRHTRCGRDWSSDVCSSVLVATPQLPEEVRRQGVTIKKQSSSIVLAISLTSPPPKDRYDLILEPAALTDLRLTKEAVSDALARQGARMDPDPEGRANAYRVTVPDEFAADGPAGADKLRDLSLAPGSGGPP